MTIRLVASFRGWFVLLGALLVMGAGVRTVQAQQQSGQTREELETALATAERELASGRLNEVEREEKQLEVESIRHRLRDGDIEVGDRIALRIQGHETYSDTFVVRAGRVLQLPDLPDIQLAGVLRSELHDYLTIHLGKYVRDPRIDVTPLVRVGILGPVGRPGFYALSTDLLLSDVIMYAGGPGGNADMRRSKIRRGSQSVLSGRGFQRAIQEGRTLDELNLRAGDEVVLGERRDWYTSLRIVGMVLGLAFTVGLLAR
jgi:hypothetical protein